MATSVSYAVATWTALGSNVQLLVHPEPVGAPAARRAAEVLAEVDRACSRFRTDSDLTRVNQHAGEWVEISPVLHDALAVALAAAELTRGIVDPTLGLVLSGLGYDRDYLELRARDAATRGAAAPGAVPSRRARPAAGPRSRADHGPASVALPAAVGSWRGVELADHAVRIPFGRALDLGATGKAFASDLVVRTLAEEFGADAMMSLGGDVAVSGTGGHDWQVVVCETPDQTGTTAGRLAPRGEHDELVRLPSGGLTTSSVVWRRWRQGGQERHHLIDPRTGAPARRVWRTASVMAPDCATANAASSASVILGDLAVAWLTEQHLAARLVHADGHVVHIGGWPSPDPAARALNPRSRR